MIEFLQAKPRLQSISLGYDGITPPRNRALSMMSVAMAGEICWFNCSPICYVWRHRVSETWFQQSSSVAAGGQRHTLRNGSLKGSSDAHCTTPLPSGRSLLLLLLTFCSFSSCPCAVLNFTVLCCRIFRCLPSDCVTR
jgi:hypothetical protein